ACDSVAHQRDALPYTVLLQAALEQTRLADTTGLEGRALAELAARSPSDTASANWRSESPLAVRADLAALHRDAERTAAALTEAKQRGVAEYFWHSERPAFDGVRRHRAVSALLHQPGAERGMDGRRQALGITRALAEFVR